MNHFHPTILIVLLQRHPHALNKSSLNAGRWHKWQNNHRSVSRRLCSSSGSPTATLCPSWDQASLWNSVHLRIYFFFWGGVFSCDKWEFCTVVLCDCYTTEQASKEFVRPQIMFFKKLEEPVKILIFGSPETSPSSWRAVKFNLSRFQDHFPSSKEGAIPWAGHRKNHKWVPLLFFFAVKSALLPPLIFCITRGFIPWRLSGVTMREFIICGTKCRWLFIGP